jgi:peptide deformylase
MTSILRLGNPILRKPARKLSKNEVLSLKTRTVIAEMKALVDSNKYGVGISANQIGEDMAISIIAIKPTPTRPDSLHFESILINPEIIEVFGRKVSVWEGCLSCGVGKNAIFGRVTRHKKVRVKYLNETGDPREATLDGLAAHVIQHEIDHLNGIIFLDKAQRKNLMMADEYRTRIADTKYGNYYEREIK